LLLWVAENRPNGNLQGLAGEDIEIAAGWKGEPGAFVSALADVRFLDGSDGSYTVHDWAEHNPWVANRDQRVKAAKDAAAARWKAPRAETHVSARDANADGMRSACVAQGDRNADLMRQSMPTTQPNQSQPEPNTTPKPAGDGSPAKWMPVESWAGFVEMRKRIRAPLTDRAIALIVKKLENIRLTSNDNIGEVLDQSTRNSWRDVYELGGHANRKGPGTGNRANQRQTRRMDDERVQSEINIARQRASARAN